jgi:hypothetical protein
MNATEEEIERHVAVRMERQALLKQPDSPQLWAVLNEAVIRRVIGDRAIMHEQLRSRDISSSMSTCAPRHCLWTSRGG